MKHKLLFILFLFGSLLSSAYGQDSLAYKSKWQIRILAGGNIPITNLLQGNYVDYLLHYNDHSYYLQILSVSYFFHKHWGIDANLVQFCSSKRIGERNDNFVASMQSKYGDKYYVNAETNDIYEDMKSFYRANIGIIYRFETNKFYLYPKFSIGITDISTDDWQVHLKEKNSNNEYKLFFSKNNKPNYSLSLTLTPSVSFGYKLSKRVFFNADIILSHFRPSFTFEKEFVNLYTKESTVEYFDYKKDIFTLSLGAGLIFAIR